jgi:hypothetical protein
VPIIYRLAALLVDHFVLFDHPTGPLSERQQTQWPTDLGILRRRTHAR